MTLKITTGFLFAATLIISGCKGIDCTEQNNDSIVQAKKNLDSVILNSFASDVRVLSLFIDAKSKTENDAYLRLRESIARLLLMAQIQGIPASEMSNDSIDAFCIVDAYWDEWGFADSFPGSKEYIIVYLKNLRPLYTTRVRPDERQTAWPNFLREKMESCGKGTLAEIS